MTDIESVTDQQIENLAKQSAYAGDLLMTAIAYRAIEWDGSLRRVALTSAERAKVAAMSIDEARRACVRAILHARAQR